MAKAKSVEDVVLGEAKAGDFKDMLAIASVIENRSRQLGVTYEQVVQNQREFNAYNKSLPPGVNQHRDMAQKALEQVRAKGPVHNATFYATPTAAKGLPSGLSYVTETKGHQFFSDPKNRAIGTSVGYVRPSQEPVNVAGQAPETLYDVSNPPTPEARPDPGLLSSPTAPAGLAALTSPESMDRARSRMGFKSSSVANAFSSMAPEMQSAYAGIERGLANPSDYTVTSTAEARSRSPSATHVRDRGAVDVRTTGMAQKQLDDLAVAAMYDPRIQSISWDNRNFDPHAHLGTSPAYGAGLQRASNISGLSPGVQDAMRSWDADTRSGVNTVGRMVPESIAPRGIVSRNAPVGQVERGLLADVPGVKQSQQANAASITGNISMPTQGPRFSAPVDQFAARSVESTPSMSSAQRAELTAGLNQQAAAMRAAPADIRATPASLSSITRSTPVDMAAMAQQYGQYRPGTVPMNLVDLETRRIAPPPAPQPAPPAPVVAPPAPVAMPQPPQVSAPSMARPSAPVTPPSQFTGQDVWSGRAMSGVATNGNQMTRNPDGTVSRTTNFGHTETVNPDGSFHSTTAPGLFGIDAAASRAFGVSPGIQGPLGHPGIKTQEPQGKPSGSRVGGTLRGAAGGVAGGMVGGLLGPVGSLLGSYLGSQMAQGKNPLGGLLGQTPKQTYQQGYTPGLAFPDQPQGVGSQGGLTSFGEAAARGEYGGQASHAANNPGTGLF